MYWVILDMVLYSNCFFFVFFFFFKQKTAYEMRISDWSSDVCSSDLDPHQRRLIGDVAEVLARQIKRQPARRRERGQHAEQQQQGVIDTRFTQAEDTSPFGHDAVTRGAPPPDLGIRSDSVLVAGAAQPINAPSRSTSNRNPIASHSYT